MSTSTPEASPEYAPFDLSRIPPEDEEWLVANGWRRRSTSTTSFSHSLGSEHALVKWFSPGNYWAYTREVADAWHACDSVVEAATILLLEG